VYDDPYCFGKVNENSVILLFHLISLWIPKHNGACVSECIARRLGLDWGEFCLAVIEIATTEGLESGIHTL
jgi:hypothetical protein